jgi:hypothetical protein
MDQDKKIEQTFKEFEDVAKENPNIDVASLMINTLQNQQKNQVSSKQKKWAYAISLGLPPFGFLFALKFYLDDKDDAKSVGNICIILTIVSMVVLVLSSKLFFSGTGTSMQQLQQIKPSDVIQAGQ